MALVKICPSCGCQNALSNSLCDDCMADISGINPTDPEVHVTEEVLDGTVSHLPSEPGEIVPHEQEKNVVEDASATVIERKRTLRFEASDGSGGFSVNSGGTVGREGEGKSYLSAHRTVSRRHARLTYDGTWKIEDTGSANGTWVNEHKLEPGELCPLKTGDRVALSHSCIFNIKE